MKKLSKKALNKSFLNWFYGHLTCFSQEHMQTFGYMLAMLPILQDLYDTNEEQTEKMQTYTAFFNTEPQVGSVVVGITAGMEEARANGEPVDGETINGIRAGLMGPLAGIGDSLVVGTVIPHPAGHRPQPVRRRFSPGRHLLHPGLEHRHVPHHAPALLQGL